MVVLNIFAIIPHEGDTMDLHNTTKYAIRILNYLANESDEQLVSAKTLSQKLDIPYKFLTKIMTNLVKEGFIVSIRGREGGFELARPANEIHLSQVLDVIDGSLEDKTCILGIGSCDDRKRCALHDQWTKPKILIRKMFENTTLDMLKGNKFKQ